MLREFPLKYREQLPLLFHPAPVETIEAEVAEVGPGRGDFLLQSAEANPTVQFVAVELGKRRYTRLAKRIERRGLTNVLLIYGDARAVLPKFCHAGRLRQIYVLFPDPWPKNRHVQNRLLQSHFLRILTDLLMPGGEIFVATDVRDYIDWVVRNATQIEQLECTNAQTPNLSPISMYQPTYFEQKWRAEGREIWYAAFRKVTA